MAQLGVRTIDELVGRADLLKQRDMSDHWKACTLDLKALLYRPKVAPTAWRRIRCTTQHHPIEHVLDQQAHRGLASRRSSASAPVRAVVPDPQREPHGRARCSRASS